MYPLTHSNVLINLLSTCSLGYSIPQHVWLLAVHNWCTNSLSPPLLSSSHSLKASTTFLQWQYMEINYSKGDDIYGGTTGVVCVLAGAPKRGHVIHYQDWLFTDDERLN